MQAQKKKMLRQELLEKRRSLSAADVLRRSQDLTDVLAVWLKAESPAMVCSFAAYKSEPDLSSLAVKLPGITWGLPVLGKNPREMSFYQWRVGDPLLANRFGILEPNPIVAAPFQLAPSAIVLVPSIALDQQGFRLGYGGGYYDELMARYPELITVGVVFKEFILESLPTEAHDQSVNYVACETGILPTRPI